MLLILCFGSFGLIFLILLQLSNYMDTISFKHVVMYLCILLLFGLIFNFIYVITSLTIISLFVIYALIFFLNIKVSFLNLITVGIIGAIFGNMLYTYSRYSHVIRKNRKKYTTLERLKNILVMIWKTFGLNITIRDYAKLTSAILHNLNIEHYFLFINRHVAVGVKINDTYYVIDQKLPLYRIDVWLKNHNAKTVKIYNSKLEYCGKFKFEYFKQGTKITSENLQKIESDIKNELKINESNEKCEYIKSIPFYNVIENYDEVTHHSIVRWIVNQIYKEFLVNIKNIRQIKVSIHKNHIIANVYYKMN
ncbi:hypothetical protein JH146_0604 [Methanocaldococcus bathoardescens]|uniref:Transglutaminase-like domain-containing protein n=2 Tax=Methanocaldococcus bathoardescens TaxID=1301915 RepID=A0A076LG46_9EURY|nr:hypothetical protein JH146_0604 [Methanocaldococcus bathoardescens]